LSSFLASSIFWLSSWVNNPAVTSFYLVVMNS
jgi:hypothetical protein